jgi:17beta-estradiol 17-dehydrogenase / very-long-chain 3-oxoacyl-CoA reductase
VSSGLPNNTTPFWSHALLDYLIAVVGYKSFFVRYTHKMHVAVRRRVLRKMEKGKGL